ncbi:hypothetical protein [Paenirhodobacter sp. CAU 1674]|uniref:hypothetical protein n=1 Tax=Paenirhodobacter sp. CAU 1674 TaxID=3032596 RepID=UPI0023D9D69A|nr:hypothetical protein [Paenirhodobacter sp. CAU 1674]MDF2143285.1 hypothetical protein [Paenirhodobacter sp. CAU 1674]
MAKPKNCLTVEGGMVCVWSDGIGQFVDHGELLTLMRGSRSLQVVGQRFRGSRRNILEVLMHFGFDFDQLLRAQFAEGLPDAQLMKIHGVGARWVSHKRRELGFSPGAGRPAAAIRDDEVLEACARAPSHAAAARLLQIDRKTFKKRLDQVRARESVATGTCAQEG